MVYYPSRHIVNASNTAATASLEEPIKCESDTVGCQGGYITGNTEHAYSPSLSVCLSRVKTRNHLARLTIHDAPVYDRLLRSRSLHCCSCPGGVYPNIRLRE